MVHLPSKFSRLAFFFSNNPPPKVVILLFTLVMLGFIGVNDRNKILVFLPGTQVGTVDPADDVQTCKQCHSSESIVRPVILFKQWSGSMMAHSARDPIFFAALAVGNKYRNGSGEYCIRCHSPSGWLSGHSEDFSGQALRGGDFNGVQCDYCHRSIDPLHPDSSAPYLVFPVPGYGNGMHVVQKTATPKRGPYDSLAAPHPTKYDSFQRSSEMCGVCHDISNPYYADDRITQAPFEYAPLERTYSEWLMSWYAAQGSSGTCQSCHMKDTTGFVCVYPNAPYRTNIARHDLTGGNTFLPEILAAVRPATDSLNLDTAAIADGKRRATDMLQHAADLHIDSYHQGDSVITRVRIINLTGHKLPTGYPEGRRMWINLIGKDVSGDTVFQSGVYDSTSGTLSQDNQLKKYEIILGLTSSTAATYGLSTGASFHFALNDTIIFDNRIPPKGFTNTNFLIRNAQPVGVAYADSQYWDITQYILPSSASEVTATIYYQTISKEYMEFLLDQNSGNYYDWNNWGNKLYNAWDTHGKSRPVAMNSKTVAVSDTPTAVNPPVKSLLPTSISLLQNYPNPFNPSTTISYAIPRRAFVSVKVFDILGREIMTLVNEIQSPGVYSVPFKSRELPSGLYLYSLAVEGNRRTKKMLLLK